MQPRDRSFIPAILLGFAVLLLHVFTNGAYGYFRDELYLLACSDHLSWGYVDHPPLVALIAKLNRALLGDSLQAIRFPSAIASAALVVLTGLIARELGGRTFAIALAALSIALTPVYLVDGTLFTMNAFEPLFWMGCAFVLLLAINRGNLKLLVWIGVLAGLGLQNKHSIAFFLSALVGGLLLTPQRTLLFNRWALLAGVVAFALFLPNLIWQIQHSFPEIQALQNAKRQHKNVEVSPPAFLLQQVMMMNPVAALVWIPGLGFLFRNDGGRYRVLAWTYLIVLAIIMGLHGKDYYVAPAYPMVLAAGAALWERASTIRFRFVRYALALLLIAFGGFLTPMFVPLLPVDRLVTYQNRFRLAPQPTERGHSGALPQYFGDMFGWPEMVDKVASVYNALPPAEREKAAIYTTNYGEAGAIDLLGAHAGLPKAISGHETYSMWGPRDYTGEIIIVVGDHSPADARDVCTSVDMGPRVSHPYAMAEENDYRIYTCRGLKMPLRELWPRLTHWN